MTEECQDTSQDKGLRVVHKADMDWEVIPSAQIDFVTVNLLSKKGRGLFAEESDNNNNYMRQMD